MPRLKSLPVLSVLFLVVLGGCATLEVAREVQSGRSALRRGTPEAAVPHFQAAARIDPDYTTDFTLADIGVWTYLGRAYLEAGQEDKALEALKKAAAQSARDHFSRIYLGLVLAEGGMPREGIAQLEAGLKGLRVWLKEVPGYARQGQYWDPGNVMAKRAAETLDLLEAEPVDWEQVKENVLWLGAAFDEEIDEVQRQKQLEQDRSRHSSRGIHK